jgi:hypothetical protein
LGSYREDNMLKQIKLLHTIVWAIMSAACVYILYAGLTGTTNVLVWSCVGLIVLEGIVLLLNGWVCPLTPIARKYTTDQRENFDIYLPEWLAKHNKTIFTIIFVVGVSLLLIRVIVAKSWMI